MQSVRAGGDFLPMMTPNTLNVADDPNTPIAMQHIGALIDLQMQFSGLEDDRVYTLTNLKFGGKTVNNFLTMDYDVNINDITDNDMVKGNIEVTDIDMPIANSKDGEIYKVQFNILPFSLPSGESVDIELNFQDEELNSYVQEVSVINNQSQVLDFKRSTHNAIKASCDMTESVEEVMLEVELSADDEFIELYNNDVVTFTVMRGDKDITSGAKIVEVTDGSYNVLSTNSYKCNAPGLYSFIAAVGDKVSEAISIEVIDKTNLSSQFYRRSLVMQFTGAWCKFCPQATYVLDTLENSYPDSFVRIAMHSQDCLSTLSSEMYFDEFQIMAIPTVIFDMNPSFSHYPLWDKLVQTLLKAQEFSQAEAGIKLTTELAGTGELDVDIEVSVVNGGNYKILCALTGDDFQVKQEGADDDYRHNNVLLGFLQENALGDMLCQDYTRAESVISKNYKLSLWNSEVELEKAHIVVAILRCNDDGRYTVTNVVECAVGESVDYDYI